MKKYRCKIDSPFGKKGTIFLDNCPIILDEKTTSNGFRVALGMYSADDYPDLFEEIPDRWVPEEQDDFFYIQYCMAIEGRIWEPEDFPIQMEFLKSNNIFRTKEKAQAVLDKILKLLEEEKEV